MSIIKKTSTGLGILGAGLTAGWIAANQVAGYKAHNLFTLKGRTDEMLDYFLEETATKTWNGRIEENFFKQRVETLQACGLRALFIPVSSMDFVFFDWDKPHPEIEEKYLRYETTICMDLDTEDYSAENFQLSDFN